MVMAFALPALAQKPKDKDARRQEMLEFKLDYLGKELELRDDQKKQFNELYTQMENDRRAILRRMKKAEKNIAEGKDVSESDYEKATKEIMNSRSEMVQIEQQYDEKFATFLSKKQMFKLKEAENKFMQKMQSCKNKKMSEDKKKHDSKGK